MRSVEEQQARVAAAAVAPRPVRVAIAEAQGLMCAEEVVTERPLPGFDQAAIDGYAVRSVDVLGVRGDDSDSEDDGNEEAIIDADDTGMIGSERQLFEEEITEALGDEEDEGSEESAT